MKTASLELKGVDAVIVVAGLSALSLVLGVSLSESI